MSEDKFKELGEGNGPFLPVVFCLDVSGSMSGRIQQLEEGLRQFIQDVQEDDVANMTAQGAIVTFADDVQLIQDFCPVSDWRIPRLVADGATNLVGAVEYALQILDERKQYYKSTGCTYYQPWLVIMSDGGQWPEDPFGIDRVSSRVVELSSNRKMVCFPIGVGNGVFWEDMKKFSHNHIALEQKDGNSFKEFFNFFSKSASATVRSNLSQGHQIDFDALQQAFNVQS